MNALIAVAIALGLITFVVLILHGKPSKAVPLPLSERREPN